jgi:hypothetical protein
MLVYASTACVVPRDPISRFLISPKGGYKRKLAKACQSYGLCRCQWATILGLVICTTTKVTTREFTNYNPSTDFPFQFAVLDIELMYLVLNTC